MYLLRRTDRKVTDVCLDVGFSSLGTFSRTFRDMVGETPTEFRGHHGVAAGPVPACFAMAWTRPSSFGEAHRASLWDRLRLARPLRQPHPLLAADDPGLSGFAVPGHAELTAAEDLRPIRRTKRRAEQGRPVLGVAG